MLVVPIYNILVLPFSEVYLSSEFIKNMKIDEDVKGKEIVFLLAKNILELCCEMHSSYLNSI